MTTRAVCCILGAMMFSCVPWTVVTLEEKPQQSSSSDPAAYVDSIWNSRLLPAVRENAIDLPVAVARGAEGLAQHFLVKGSGRVLSLDTTSRSGRLLFDAEPYDGEADGALMIGPVILGTALRDAAGFIEFTDFLNQLQYADVANALNQRVITDVVGLLDLPSLQGKTISFYGAWTVSATPIPEIVPVEVTVE